MIDVTPLVQASENCEDSEEKNLLRFLSQQAALDLPHPRRLYETGEAVKHLSPVGFVVFEKVMKTVYEERKRVEAAGYEARRCGWSMVCSMEAVNKEENSNKEVGSSDAVKKGESSKGKGLAKSGSKRPRSTPAKPKFSRTNFFRRTRSVGAKLAVPSSSEEEDKNEDASDDVQVLGEGWEGGEFAGGGAVPIFISSNEEEQGCEVQFFLSPLFT